MTGWMALRHRVRSQFSRMKKRALAHLLEPSLFTLDDPVLLGKSASIAAQSAQQKISAPRRCRHPLRIPGLDADYCPDCLTCLPDW